ncbi:MAG: oligosaccharide flippase family protein, partial [Candidatus Bathyarchaeia archaeon]
QKMQKAIEMGKTSAKGSLELFIGVAASTIIMAVGTIILARLMTPEEYGLYSVALIPSYTAIIFRDWGVNSAITKYIASLRAENKEEKTREIIKAGILFEAVVGLILSVLLASIAGFIASTIFQRPESSRLISVASITVFAGALLTASQATFIGFERMKLNSLTTVCQAVVKTLVAPLLVLAGYSALGAVLGYTLSFIAASLIGLIILYISIFRRIERKNLQKSSLSKTLGEMLHYGVPLSISSILAGFLQQFYAFLMAIYCTDAMIGNYQVATQFATLLTFFTFPISTVLFPAFSKINPQDERELLQTVFTSSVKYTTLVLIPATMAIMVLSKPMIGALFGEKWDYAPLFLTLYVINNLSVMFGSLSMGSLLSGLGETKLLMKLSLLTLMLGIPLSLFLIPTMGITGLILTLILEGKPSMAIGLHRIWKRYKAKVDIKASAKVFAASLVASAATFLALNVVAYVDWIELVIGGVTFLLTFLVFATLIGAINASDVQNLRLMFSGLGVISKMLEAPLILVNKLLKAGKAANYKFR